MNKHQGELFIVSGSSGVGKTTLVSEFLQQYQNQYQLSQVVTYTTRSPRLHDVNGVDYHFISQDEFEYKVKTGFFLEWSGEYGAYYGTPSNILNELAAGESKILVIDRVGAAQIVEKYSHAILVWIQVSDLSVLALRLKGRNSETQEQVQKRLSLAMKETEEELNAPMYHYYINNDELDSAICNLLELVTFRC